MSPDTKLSTWLYRVTVNLCLDLLRKRSRRPQAVSLQSPAGDEEGFPLESRIPDPSGLTPRGRLVQEERATGVRRAVGNLPAALKAPLLLSTFEGLSQQEIASILRISPKAVERRLSRARALLKQTLTPYL